MAGLVKHNADAHADNSKSSRSRMRNPNGWNDAEVLLKIRATPTDRFECANLGALNYQKGTTWSTLWHLLPTTLAGYRSESAHENRFPAHTGKEPFAYINKDVPVGSPPGTFAIDIPHITTWEIK